MKGTAHPHTYRLKLTPGQPRVPREIEFEAPGAESALQVARSMCGAGRIEMYEDGRRLANLRLSSADGFWIVG